MSEPSSLEIDSLAHRVRYIYSPQNLVLKSLLEKNKKQQRSIFERKRDSRIGEKEK